MAFVQVAPGIEKLLAEELLKLGFKSTRSLVGGVEVRLDARELFRLCLSTRLAENVRVRLKPFEARSFAELEQGLSLLPFRAFLPSGCGTSVSVVCHLSRLWHSGAVLERVNRILTDRVGVRIASEGESSEPSSRVFVRLDKDEVQVSVDASGPRLHRRGYRKHVAPASLRETIAAAAMFAFERDLGSVPRLWDPFAGAGTIALEAAHSRSGRLPGESRPVSLEQWPSLRNIDFEAERAAFVQSATSASLAVMEIWASDLSRDAVEAARQNLESAHLPSGSPSVHLLEGDIEQIADQIPHRTAIVTNPPYGKRLAEKEALSKLLRLLERRSDLRPCAVLVGGEAKRRLPAQFRSVLTTQNGGLNVALRVLF